MGMRMDGFEMVRGLSIDDLDLMRGLVWHDSMDDLDEEERSISMEVKTSPKQSLRLWASPSSSNMSVVR